MVYHIFFPPSRKGILIYVGTWSIFSYCDELLRKNEEISIAGTESLSCEESVEVSALVENWL